MNEWKLTGNGGRGHCGGDGHREWRHDEPRCRKWRNQCRHYHVSVTHGTTPSTRHPTDWTEVLWQWHSKGRLLGWILMTLLVSDHQQVFHDSVFLTFCTAAQTYDTHTHTHTRISSDNADLTLQLFMLFTLKNCSNHMLRRSFCPILWWSRSRRILWSVSFDSSRPLCPPEWPSVC